MTLRELEMTLPNRFHDAELGEILLDFLSSSARLKLRVLTSLPETEKETGVLYREVTVQLTGLIGIHLCSNGRIKYF